MNPRYLPLQTRDCAQLYKYLVHIGASSTSGQTDAEDHNYDDSGITGSILRDTWLPLTRFVANMQGTRLIEPQILFQNRKKRQHIIIVAGQELESRLFALFDK